MYGYIYKRQNNINGKVYIGKHRHSLPQLDYNYHGSGKLLTQAISKYGEENFTYELVDTADSLEELNELEKYYIQKYNTVTPNGYNISTGGDGGCGFENWTIEEQEGFRQRVSEGIIRSGKLKGRIPVTNGIEDKHCWPDELDSYLDKGWWKGKCARPSEESIQQGLEKRNKFYTDHPEVMQDFADRRRGEGNPMYGKQQTEKQRAAASAANKGKSLTPEHRNKLSVGRKGKHPYNYGVKGPANSGYGSYWITDGTIEGTEKWYDKYGPIPEGKYRGRVVPKRNKK